LVIALCGFAGDRSANFPALGAEGVEVRQFPADVVSAMARASEELIQEIASKGPFERQVYDSFMTYRRAANAYAQVADLAQLQVRASVVK
jgi:TRAP-type mannitol/chloroaromatic compound transport system substrate-binding protein